jgi:hypothetical protein
MTTSSNVAAGDSDLLQAIHFVQNQFAQWQQDGRISDNQGRTLAQHYDDLRKRLQTDPEVGQTLPLRPRNQCWSCRQPVDPSAEYCTPCGAPLQLAGVTTLRHLSLLGHEIKKHEREGRLPLATAHELMAEVNGLIAALRRKLDQERIPLLAAITEKPAPLAELAEPVPAPRTVSRRNLLEILLDPRSIQWLLASGGALLVLGLIIWLAAEGIFENKLVVATLLGVANFALLTGGWAVIRLTRHELAGRALTLLACLVMPLNLWFYNAQGLITLQEGGHLWVPALVCCVLYAVSARVLRDPTFVYVLVGGVTMTGLLLLADRTLDKFWEITAPATLLLGLALVCIHTERVFPEGDGPFSRKRFGLAFFWSGQVLLGTGLLFLFGAQLFGGWLFELVEPYFKQLQLEQPLIVTDPTARLLALALTLAGTYAYVYSAFVVRRAGAYLPAAVITLLWAEVQALHFVSWPLPLVEVIILSLAVTALAVNLTLAALARKDSPLQGVGPALGLALCVLPVVLGIVLHVRATAQVVPAAWRYPLTWSYVGAMLLTAISCRVGAHVFRHEKPALSFTYFFGTAAATMVGAAGLLVVLTSATRWEGQAPLLMLIPLAYLVASRLYRGHTAERPMLWVAHAATLVMLMSSIGASVRGFGFIHGDSLNLALAVFCAEAALFYGLEAAWNRHEISIYLSTAMACAAVWQLLKYQSFPDEYYTVAFAVVGLLLLIAYRFAVLESFQQPQLARATFQCGNALLSLAFVAGALMVLSDLATQHADKNLLIPLLFELMALSLVSVFLVKHEAWRRWYVATTVANVALVVLVLAILTELTRGQKLEIVSLTVGALLLGIGHVGWYREQERHNDLVSVSLFLGSLLVAAAFTVALVYCRAMETFGTFHTLNEMGMLAFGLLLLATGNMFRIRSTTLMGGFMMLVYLLSLVLFIRIPERLQTTAVYIMAGGGLFFAVGLGLSLYRDRLLALPDKIKRREGVFRILTWR